MKRKWIQRLILGLLLLGFALLIVYTEYRHEQKWKLKGEIHGNFEENRSINLCNNNGLLIRRIQLLDYS